MKGVCLIVGVGPGIGQALAMAFARDGYDVAMASRSPEKLANMATDVQVKTGRKARCFAVNAADEASVSALVDNVTAEMAAPSVAIYNAASFTLGLPLSLKPEDLVDDIRINVGGALLLAQKVAPAMRTAGSGSILFTGGGFAYEPAARYSSMSLGKAALRNLTYTLAQELGPFGIHVATVTVHGFVQRGTHFDPVRIAEAYVRLNNQPKGNFDIEVVYK